MPNMSANQRRGARVSKVKITTWVDEGTASVLRGLAAQHGVSLSELCAQKLKGSVEEEGGAVGMDILLPAVRGAVRRELARMSDRLARLMARSALESAAGRRALYQLLVSEFGADGAAGINRAAWERSVESLKKPAEGLREILGEGSVSVASEDGAASPDGERETTS